MPTKVKRLYRSRKNKVITGLASGVAEYFDIDPIIVRILFVVSPFISNGLAVILYFVISYFVPLAPTSKNK